MSKIFTTKKTIKFFTKPQKFFRDMKLISCLKSEYGINGPDDREQNIPMRIIGSAEYNLNKHVAEFDIKKVKVKGVDKDLNSLLIMSESMDEKEKESIKGMLEGDFIGFNKEYLYILETKNISSNSWDDVFNFFMYSNDLRSNILKDFKNIIFINPNSIEVMLFKYKNPTRKIISIFTKAPSKEFSQNFLQELDSIIYNKNIEEKYFQQMLKRTYNHESFDNDKESFELLKNSISEFKKKEHDMLLPVLNPESNYFNTKIINGNVQGMVKLIKTKQQNTSMSFNEMVDTMEVKSMYLKESIYMKYKTEIESEDFDKEKAKQILKRTLKEGVRYEIV